MTPTEISLLATHRSPVVRLSDICEKYFGLAPESANQKALLNLLPVPTFRVNDSRKAPRVVKISELARYLDEKAEEAKANWVASQV